MFWSDVAYFGLRRVCVYLRSQDRRGGKCLGGGSVAEAILGCSSYQILGFVPIIRFGTFLIRSELFLLSDPLKCLEGTLPCGNGFPHEAR